MPLRAVFFDLDDTLGDESWGFAAALEATCRYALDDLHLACPGGWQALYRTYVDVSDELWMRFDQWGKGLGTLGTREYTWREVLKAASVAADDAALAVIAKHYCDGREARYRWLEGARPVYEQLAATHKVGIITNGAAETQRVKLKQLGLLDCACICIGDECNASKPSAAIFQHAMALLQVTAAESVMVGDRPATDIAGAHAVGMRAVWITPAQHPWSAAWGPPPWRQIQHVRELPALLAAG